MTEIILKTPQELAEYYLGREFNARDFSEMKEMENASFGSIEVNNPSEEWYLNEFLGYEGDYQEKIKTIEDLEKEENEEIKKEFEVYVEQQQNENYPMWNTVWEITNNSDYFQADKLAEIGIGILEFKEKYYLFIAGAGYDFYEAHWIPLFTKILPWIKNEKEGLN